MHQNSPKCKRRGTPFAKNSHNANGNPIRQNCKGGNHSQKFNKMQRGNQLTKVKRADPILQRRNQRGHPIHKSGKGEHYSPKWKGGTPFTKIHQSAKGSTPLTKVQREDPIHQSAKGDPIQESEKGGPHSPKCKTGTPYTKMQWGNLIRHRAKRGGGGDPFTKEQRGPIHQSERVDSIHQYSPKSKGGSIHQNSPNCKTGTPFTKVQRGDSNHQSS